MSVFSVSLLRTDIVQGDDVERINPLNIVSPVGDEHDTAANGDKIRVLHGDSPPVRQADPEGRERRLMQPVANGFCIQH
jgi:hypothetical protein